MAYQLLYFDEVLEDVRQAKEWYNKEQEGLEVDFSRAIENALNQIKKRPAAYSIRYKNIRITHPKRFPYNIHFYIDEDDSAVIIIAIIHSKRNPKTSRKRL